MSSTTSRPLVNPPERQGWCGAESALRAARVAGATLASALMLSLLAACGGSDGGSSASGADPDEAPPEAQSPTGDPLNIDPSLLPEGVTVAMVEEGRELFLGNGGICYSCHLPDATGGPLAPDLTDDTWLNVDGRYESIVEVIKTGVAQPIEALGVMLPRAGMPLTDEQVEAVAAYAYMLSRM